MQKYNIKNIRTSINRLQLKKNDIVYVSGNLINFGKFNSKKINQLPGYFYDCIKKKIGKNGTIVFPAHSFNLVGSDILFDSKSTSSISGSFSNFIIKNKRFKRQLHPYSSIGAVGSKAKYICDYSKKDVYGKNSPFFKLFKLNAKFLSLGISINLNCTQVHYFEQKFKVPYRYFKVFNHKVLINSKIKKKKFYMYVLKNKYRNLKRNKNKIILKNFLKSNKIQEISLGIGKIYLYSLKDFYESTNNLFKKNIFAWSGKKWIN
jgi:aminoglycoside 3-N-acetyltransferase